MQALRQREAKRNCAPLDERAQNKCRGEPSARNSLVTNTLLQWHSSPLAAAAAAGAAYQASRVQSRGSSSSGGSSS